MVRDWTLSRFHGSGRHTATSTLPVVASISSLTFLEISSDRPNRNSAMNVVEIAAKATRPFRRRPDVVSRNRYSKRATLAVHPPGLVPDDVALLQLDHPAAHRVDDGLVVCGHHDRGADPVD